MVVIDRDECIECGFCEKICPKDTISTHEAYGFEIGDACISCKLCIKNCPVKAISQN